MVTDPRTGVPLETKIRAIRLLLTDCDGVLTDGKVYYSALGEDLRAFSVRDGMGVERLRRLAGVEVGIVSGERSAGLRRRAEKLQIDILHMGIRDKLAIVGEISRLRGLGLEAIAYIGDDVNDLSVLEGVGFSACPADAMPGIAERVDYVCRRTGGAEAFRELCEVIIAGHKGEDAHEVR